MADEVNVKSVVFTADLAAYCQQVLTVVPRVLGPRVGGQVQQVIKAVKAGDWSLVDGRPVAAGVTLQEGEYELRLVAADAEHSAPLPGGEGVVVLDTAVTPELAAEGWPGTWSGWCSRPAATPHLDSRRSSRRSYRSSRRFAY